MFWSTLTFTRLGVRINRGHGKGTGPVSRGTGMCFAPLGCQVSLSIEQVAACSPKFHNNSRYAAFFIRKKTLLVKQKQLLLPHSVPSTLSSAP